MQIVVHQFGHPEEGSGDGPVVQQVGCLLQSVGVSVDVNFLVLIIGELVQVKEQGLVIVGFQYTTVPKKMLIKLLIICFSVSYEDISMRRILKWMYCANFAQTFKMSQYVPNSLRVQSVVPIHR